MPDQSSIKRLSRTELEAIKSIFSDPRRHCPYFAECSECLSLRKIDTPPVCLHQSQSGLDYERVFSTLLEIAHRPESADADSAIQSFLSNAIPITCYFHSIFEYASFEMQFKALCGELSRHEFVLQSSDYKKARAKLKESVGTIEETIAGEFRSVKLLGDLKNLITDRLALVELIDAACSALDEVEAFERKIDHAANSRELWRNVQTVRLMILNPPPSQVGKGEWWVSCSVLIAAAMEAIAGRSLSEDELKSISSDALRQRTVRYGKQAPAGFKQTRATMPNILLRIGQPQAHEMLYMPPQKPLLLSERSETILKVCRAVRDGKIEFKPHSGPPDRAVQQDEMERG